MKKSILFVFIFSIILFLGCSETEEKIKEEIIDLSFDISMTSVTVIDTGTITASADLSKIKYINDFDRYGFIVEKGTGQIDTFEVGNNEILTSFTAEINSLTRNSHYSIAAFAEKKDYGLVVSNQLDPFTTYAFVLDSINPAQALPGDQIILFGHGLQDLDINTKVYLGDDWANSGIAANVISVSDEFLILSYDDPDDGNFFTSGYRGVDIYFNQGEYAYATAYDESIIIYTYKPFIRDIENATVDKGDRLEVYGNFGNSLFPIRVFLDDLKIPQFLDNGSGTISGSSNTSRLYHQLYNLDIRIPNTFESGTYKLRIQVGEYSVEAEELITIN